MYGAYLDVFEHPICLLLAALVTSSSIDLVCDLQSTIACNEIGKIEVGWLVVLGFNATLTAKVISWRSVTHMYFLAFSHQY